MKKQTLTAFLLVLSLILGISSVHAATLIGDMVILTHRCPDIDTIWDGPFEVIVAEGSSDRVLLDPFGDDIKGYGVDLETSSIHIDFIESVGFTAGDPFHGLIVEDIDWVGMPNAVIMEVNVDTNFNGFDASRVTFGDHFVRINWQDLNVPTGSVFNITLRPVPLPSTLLLLGSGLAGIIGLGRKKLFKKA
jgi:hypothetical protein